MSLLPQKYTAVVPLAPGKNATVFRAMNSFLDREVFLKIYDVPENDPKSALQEPQILQSLSHPNLARIYSADALTGNQLLLEMELVAGGSLQNLLDKSAHEKKWPGIGSALDLVADIAHGLGELHANNLVHRDIKPANIMIRNAQDRDHAVVTDLGLASALDETGRAFSSRHARIYRPPEVWDGHGYSKSSDIYQVGIVLYQLLRGTIPYGKADFDDTDLAKITIDGTLFDLSDVGPHVERTLRTLLGKCVCPESTRISTVSDLLSTIQSVKKSHVDWTYSTTVDGFDLTRTLDDRQFDVQVHSTGKSHFVTGMRKIGGGAPRRFFKDQTINHADLGRSQKFRVLLRKT